MAKKSIRGFAAARPKLRPQRWFQVWEINSDGEEFKCGDEFYATPEAAQHETIVKRTIFGSSSGAGNMSRYEAREITPQPEPPKKMPLPQKIKSSKTPPR
jgi:hypothetical protein